MAEPTASDTGRTAWDIVYIFIQNQKNQKAALLAALLGWSLIAVAVFAWRYGHIHIGTTPSPKAEAPWVAFEVVTAKGPTPSCVEAALRSLPSAGFKKIDPAVTGKNENLVFAQLDGHTGWVYCFALKESTIVSIGASGPDLQKSQQLVDQIRLKVTELLSL